MRAAMRAVMVLGAALILGWSGLVEAEEQTSAQALFARGCELFEAGDYEQALETYQRSYELSPVNVVLYNIAMSQQALGRTADAIESFEQYLERGGDRIPAERQREVRGLLEELRAQVGPAPASGAEPQPAEVSPEAEPAPRAARPGRALRVAGYVTGAISVAVLGTALGLFVWNTGRSGDWEDTSAALAQQFPLAGLEQRAELELQYEANAALGEELRSWGAAEWALLGLGVASLGAAVALLVLGLRARHAPRPQVAP